MMKGMGKVYRFTLLQFFKGTANLIFLGFLLVFSLVSIPAATWYSARTGKTGGGTIFEDAVHERIEEEEKRDAASPDNAGGDASMEGEQDAAAENQMDAEEPYDEWEEARSLYREAGLSEEQINLICTPPITDVLSVSEYQQRQKAQQDAELEETLSEAMEAEEEDTTADARFVIQYIYAVLVLILSMFATTYIIRAMVEEKSSRLVETLLVSVDPLSLIFGKILAVMTYVVAVFAIMIAGMFVSSKLTPLITGREAINPLVLAMGSQATRLRLGAGSLAIIIISLLLGFLTFALVGAIAGSSCSNMDDVEHANLAAVWILLGGYLVSVMFSAFGGTTVSLVTSLVPILSVFAAPVRYVLGHIDLPVLLLAWLLQAAFAALLAIVCARVYRGLIYYRGKRLSLWKMFTMGRKGAKQ